MLPATALHYDGMSEQFSPNWQETLDWQPTPQQQQQFEQLYNLIVAGNRQLNLTRITDPVEFWEKHLWDSLKGAQVLLNSPLPVAQPRCIDIGTGAGFPGVAVAIAQPAAQVTLLDSTRKKIVFLAAAIEQLGITNAYTLTGRAEEVGRQSSHRQAYDFAFIRAVGAAAACAEYALPLLKVGGLAILYRGHWTAAETEALRPAVQKLGGEIESVASFVTPISQSDRHCLYLRQIEPTSLAYPRAVGIPAHHPLD